MKNSKVRIWLPRQREMIYRDIELIYYADGSILVNRAGNHYSDMYDAEILWSVGVTDYNGREIYEGDVMLHAARSGRMCVVEYRATDAFSGFDLTAINSLGWAPSTFSWRDWWVIGNIYEDRELGVAVQAKREGWGG